MTPSKGVGIQIPYHIIVVSMLFSIVPRNKSLFKGEGVYQLSGALASFDSLASLASLAFEPALLVLARLGADRMVLLVLQLLGFRRG